MRTEEGSAVTRLRQAVLLFLIMGVVSPALAVCSWPTAPGTMIFANYNVFSSSPTTTDGYTLQCDKKYAWAAVKLSMPPSGTQRYMSATIAGNTYSLPYALTNATGAAWGTGESGTYFASYSNPPGKTDTFPDTIFGAIAGGADVAPGIYTDTVTAYGMWSNNTINPGPVSGANVSTSFQVSVEVTSDCTVQAFTITFPAYSPFSTLATTSASNLTVNCTKTVQATVQLDYGSSSGSPRTMKNASGMSLNYDLYKDSAFGAVWNPGNPYILSSTSKNVALNPGGGIIGLPIYASIPPLQDVEVGLYQDTVQATVNY